MTLGIIEGDSSWHLMKESNDLILCWLLVIALEETGTIRSPLEMDHNSTEYLHLLIESLRYESLPVRKRCFSNRILYSADWRSQV